MSSALKHSFLFKCDSGFSRKENTLCEKRVCSNRTLKGTKKDVVDAKKRALGVALPSTLAQRAYACPNTSSLYAAQKMCQEVRGLCVQYIFGGKCWDEYRIDAAVPLFFLAKSCRLCKNLK